MKPSDDEKDGFPAKKTRNQKKIELRARIVSASFGLFMEQGYDATTIRQILENANVLNGSLYNIFKGKDEIYSAIIKEALNESVAESRKYLGEDEDNISNATFPLILVLYAAFKSDKMASLLSVIDKKWEIKITMVDTVSEWADQFLMTKNISNEDKRVKILSCIGVIGSIIEMCENKMGGDFKDSVDVAIKMFYSAFDIPMEKMKERNEKIISIIENNDIAICGVHI